MKTCKWESRKGRETNVWVCMCSCANVSMHVYLCIHMCVWVCVYRCVHMCMYLCVGICVHVHVCKCTCVHSCWGQRSILGVIFQGLSTLKNILLVCVFVRVQCVCGHVCALECVYRLIDNFVESTVSSHLYMDSWDQSHGFGFPNKCFYPLTHLAGLHIVFCREKNLIGFVLAK